MSEKIKKIILTVLISLLTLGILIGSFSLYQQYFVNQPLSTVLETSNLIKSYEFDQKANSPVLKIELLKANNFPQEFQNFLNDSKALLEKDINLEISSNPNENILDFYDKIHPAIFEALSAGSFTQLQEKINILERKYELTKTQLTINQGYIYIQIEDHENYLYLIFNRSEQFPTIVNELGSDIS